MEQRFTSPQRIIKAKSGDWLQFSVEDDTPFTPQLNVYSLAGVLLYGPINYSSATADHLYYFVRANSSYGMSTVLTYYHVKAEDSLPGYPDRRWMVYLTDDATFEGIIARSLGLSGHNIRMFSHVWTRGQLTRFDIKIYSTAALLDLAEAGTSDMFIAHYRVTISYDSNYNPYIKQCVRVA